ncbi:MAG: EAL domain-containing response regulator [Proteobacteria bacterium]|nr:EAL domain-containing response regulator [Pseudomonadota bacterium]
MSNRLLIIDDEPEFGNFVERIAQDAGFDVRVTTRAEDFKDAFKQWMPTAIVLDLVIPETDGIELLRWLISENCQAPVVILSGFDARILDAARRVGRERGLNIACALMKPVRAGDLKERLTALCKAEPAALNLLDLERALRNGEMFIFYQPKVSLENGALVGTEALLRWLHPQRGVVPTDQIITLAENTPLAELIGEFVMRQALAQQKAWAREGMDLPVSVNVSAASLYDEKLADRIASLCAHEEVSPEKLIVEITESAAMSHAVEALDILTRLRIKGFPLSIDDFGTGFSSLTRLQRVPATEIKIDRSFVSEAPTSQAALAIVKSVIGLAKNMNLTCVAEGIESARHYRMLSELGCEAGQGYAIAKPLAGDKLGAWKNTWVPPYQKRRYGPRKIESAPEEKSQQSLA